MKRLLFAALATLFYFCPPSAFAQNAPTNYPGCQYLSSIGTLADKQTAILNCTQGKLLKVEATPAAGVNQDVNITGVGGNVVTTTVPVAGSGTAGSAATGVVTVQGIASGTAVNVGGPVADDAAASGNPVPVGGIYNTTLPTYSNLDRTQAQFGSRGELIVGGTVGSGVADLGNPVKVGGKYNNAGVTLADGNRGDLQLSSQASAMISIQATGTTGIDGVTNTLRLPTGVTGAFVQQQTVPLIFNSSTWDRQRSIINATDSTGTGIAAAGLVAQCDDTSPTATTENQFGNLTRNCTTGALKVENGGDLFLNITAATPTTTTVKSGVGRFHKLCINKPAATGAITMYDNTAASGTLIGTITQPAALLSSGPVCIAYDIVFGTGLTIVTATAAQDLTVTYR